MPLTVKEAALSSDWSRIRAICMVLTLTSGVVLGLPLFLSAVAPRAQPALVDEAPSLDPILTVCALLQLLAFGAFLLVPRFWRKLSRRAAGADEAWDAGRVVEAWGIAWIMRYAFGEAVCLVAGVGLFLGYQNGLLPDATRFAWLCLLPLFVLVWMLRHWPDKDVLHAAFFNS